MKNINIKQFQEFILIKKSIRLILLISIIFTFFPFTAEARWSYGHLVKSYEVENEFKTGTIPTNYSYYFNGWTSEPDAIIGISKDYVLKSKLWKPFNPEELSIQTLRQRMYQRNRNRGSFQGAWLKDHKGEIMGIYFSDNKNATIKMAGDKQIAYITPIVRSRHRSFYGDR